MTKLTEEQAAVYDRQIRVWGADVQKRLSEAKVLVLGCTPVAAETCKNFVLAGVGVVNLIDDTPASSAPATFLLNADENPSTSAAQAFARTLQDMNPMVSVSALPGAAGTFEDAALLKEHQLVMVFGQHAGCQDRVNALCRAHGVRFISVVSRGAVAYAFADLLVHEYKAKAGAEGNALPLETFTYAPLASALATPWSKLPTRRMFHRFLGVYTVVAAFESKEGRFASRDDLDALRALGKQRLQECGCKEQFWADDLLELYVSYPQEFPPVNAIVGGMVANDVVRCLSHVGKPTMNVLLFSLQDNNAQIHNLTA